MSRRGTVRERRKLVALRADSLRNANAKKRERAEPSGYGLRAEAGLGGACFFWKSLITAIFWRKI